MLKSLLRNAVDRLDSAGQRGLLAGLANGASGLMGRGQRFEVDADGDWVNRQSDAVFVSPDLLFSRYAAKHRAIIDLWCHQYAPKRGDVVIDVGAGIGDEAVIFSRMVGETGRVIAIEAHPHTFRCLEKTIERSGLKNVTALHCAVADTEGSLTIEDSADQNHISHSVIKSSGKGVEVPAHRLDTIMDQHGLDDVALLKMNIEGAERLAVQGLGKRDRDIAHYAISCHDFVADRDGDASNDLRTREEILAFFNSRQMKVERRTEDPRPWVRDYIYARL